MPGKYPAQPGDGANRALKWPDCQNARDLGGLPHPGGVTRSRALVRSDDVSYLNVAGREAMRAYGVATVIDLRSRSEREGTFDSRFPRPAGHADRAPGVTYLNHELVDDASLKRLGEASDMLDRYLLMLNTRQPAFREIFTAIAEAEGGVLFHCFAGKDRTGLVAAMLLALAGVADEDIVADFGATDIQLAAQYERWIAGAAVDKRDQMRDELRCPPERILGVLDHLRERWGGVECYLESCGVSAINMKRLATKLT